MDGSMTTAIPQPQRHSDDGSEHARAVMLRIDDLMSRHSPEEAWNIVSRAILKPGVDFHLHRKAYARCYGDDALAGESVNPAWMPTAEVIARANVTAAAQDAGCADYRSLQRWSTENRPAFWEMAMRRLGIVLRKPYERIVDASDPIRPVWLPGAQMNIVESCLRAAPDAPAIIYSSGTAAPEITTTDDLRRLTARVSNALPDLRVGPGDAVAVVMPMTPQAVAIYLGIIAAGVAAVSIPDSFAPAEIATRLRISSAKLVFTQDVVLRGEKRLPLYERVASADAPVTIVLPADAEPEVALRPQDVRWHDFLSDDDRLLPVACAPQDAINILFSSGTTGDPKAIPWDHTTPIKAAADGHFHQDIHPGDVVCWPTSLGWMMGPWLIFASLINRASIALYGQSPVEAGFGRFVQDARVTMLGLVPSMARAWRQSRCMEGLDWSALRAFSSSGECSNAEDMLYLMHLAGYRPVIEYCGGTEIGGAYITGTVAQPCVPAAFTTPALGIDFLLLDDEQRPQTTGEAFLNGPSMGLSTRLLNRDHDAVYFDDAPRTAEGAILRRHGDEVQALRNGYYRVVGRCDDTMNLGGIKVGCAEIERAVSGIEGVSEAAAIAVPQANGGPSQLVVFVAPAPGYDFEEAALKASIQSAIREKLNPLFRVEKARIVASLPRTASNKIMRRALRALAAKADG